MAKHPHRAIRRSALRIALPVLVLGLGWVLVPDSASGQVPAPRVPELRERSGLVSRYTPVIPRLPQDNDRDSFLGARYQDEDDDDVLLLHPRNSCKNGGMYGKILCADCTAAVYPYFRGSPSSSIGPDCKGHNPVTGRWITNFVKPFKPVGMYYDRGVYVPIYDLDYWVPGPGPFPWPFFFKRPTGG